MPGIGQSTTVTTAPGAGAAGQSQRPEGGSGAKKGRRRRGGLALKMVIGTTAVVALGGASVATLSWNSAEAPAKSDQFVVARRSFDITASGNGELRARKQTTIRSMLEQQCAIVEIIPEGSRVNKGDILVRLNSDDIQKRLDDDMLQLESARSDMISADNAYQIQISDNDSATRQAKLKVEIAELELQKWQDGDVVEKRKGLQLDLERAQREYERLEAKFERAKLLYSREFLSKDELDKDEVAFIEAKSKLETSGIALDVYEKYTYTKDLKQKTSDLDEARAELERTQRKNESELASKEAQLTNKKRQWQLRDERVAKLREQVDNCTVKAPTDGLVVYATSLNQNMYGGDGNAYDVGSEIRPNQEIIALPDTTEMVATIKIPEAILSRVKIGQRAHVVIDAAQGKTYTGAVETIGVMAQIAGWRDPNVREYEVRIGLDLGSDPHKLKPSMRCEAKIVLDSVDDALAVPIQAVFAEGRRQFVYTAAGDMYAQTPVQVGRRSDSFVEIVSGLSGGEVVLLREPAPGRVLKMLEPEKAEGPAIAGVGGAGGENRRPGPGMGAGRGGVRPARGGAAGVSGAGAEGMRARSEPAATETSGDDKSASTPEAAAEAKSEPASDSPARRDRTKPTTTEKLSDATPAPAQGG